MDLRQICIPIRSEVDSVEAFIASHLNSRYSFVQGVTDYVMKNGGKRLRPILTIASARLSGYQGEGAVALGTAIEFLHTASLLHDDVIDNATLRRGRDAPNRLWGNHVSVLVGDFFYCRAMDLLVKQGDLKILRIVTDAVTLTTEGEIFEITKTSDLAMSEDDYMEIIGNKTAALMGAASQTGAILGRVSEEFETSLRRYGFHLGLAFQLVDDVLDYTQPADVSGKDSGLDLKEGKLTLPLILVLKRCTDRELKLVREALISRQIDPASFREVHKIIDNYDGVRDTLKVAQGHVQKAKESLLPFRPSLEQETLVSIADYVLLRKN